MATTQGYLQTFSLGGNHSSVITETGKLYTWGYNTQGQLGDGSTTNISTPTLIDSFGGEKIVAVSLGSSHSSVITETGKLYTWGSNVNGQVGDGTTTQRNTPTLIDSFNGEKIVAVSLGWYHSSAITETGKLYTWGRNDYGQVGDGTTTQRNTPTLIDSFGGEKVVAVSLGYYHSSAITETGKLYTWGRNYVGQLGDGTTTTRTTPTLIDSFGGEKIVAISLGGYHSSVITETGKLYIWGSNGNGQVGNGTTAQRNTPTLIDSFGGEKIVAVSLGASHSSVITETGKLYTWGYNNFGRLGDGTTTQRNTPTLIDAFNGEKIVAISLGGSHSSAITETGKLYTWGFNNYGQVGDGTTVDKYTPTLIDSIIVKSPIPFSSMDWSKFNKGLLTERYIVNKDPDTGIITDNLQFKLADGTIIPHEIVDYDKGLIRLNIPQLAVGDNKIYMSYTDTPSEHALPLPDGKTEYKKQITMMNKKYKISYKTN